MFNFDAKNASFTGQTDFTQLGIIWLLWSGFVWATYCQCVLSQWPMVYHQVDRGTDTEGEQCTNRNKMSFSHLKKKEANLKIKHIKK